MQRATVRERRAPRGGCAEKSVRVQVTTSLSPVGRIMFGCFMAYCLILSKIPFYFYLYDHF